MSDEFYIINMIISDDSFVRFIGEIIIFSFSIVNFSMNMNNKYYVFFLKRQGK